MIKCFRKQNCVAAFSRIDLIVVIVVLVVLGAGLYAFIGRSRTSSSAVCASNLKQLGVAMALYEQDNGGRLPYAYLRFGRQNDFTTSKFVWDSLIFPLIPLGQNGLAQKHLLRCPADAILGNQGQARRTYAMPSHSTRNADWPLSSENATGVGVWWDWGFGKRRTANMTNYISVTLTTNNDGKASTTVTMPAVKLDMIHAPASTLLLTENARAYNTAFNHNGALIDSAQTHVSTNLDLNLYHGGKINYLMVDGHVELLYPSESMGQADLKDNNPREKYPNIWTIRPDD